MTRMRAVDAAVAILVKEGATEAFGLPGAAINPFYSAMRANGGVRHTLARHVEGASHMADGYTQSADGNIGVCIGTSGPAGTDMITGLYAAHADSLPILCITGQAPVAKLHKEDFQAVDIATIASSLTKLAMTVMEPAQVPGAFQRAFQLMRSGRPGPVLLDLPIDVQLAEIEFDIDTYEPLPIVKPTATRAQAEKALDMLLASAHPLIIAGGGIINAGASERLVELAEILGVPVVPTLMGWGILPDDHELNAGMVGIQTGHRYGNQTFLASDFVIGVGNRWANRHTGGLDTYRAGRTFIHVDIEPTQIGRVFAPDYSIVSDAGAALDALLAVARDRAEAGELRDYSAWAASAQERKRTLQRKTHFDAIPIKPQRVYEEMNRAFGRDATYVTTIGLSQIAGAQLLHVFGPRRWINAAQAGPLGWTGPAALGVVRGKPGQTVVALSGDYDFQFMVEELAVGAQHKLPYIHVVVNNSYLGLIRQAQRPFEMDYHVSLAFENINSPETAGYGVDHVKVAEGLGCKAIRVTAPDNLADAFAEAQRFMAEFQVPVVVEVILERVTNIAMGAELDAVNEFEDLALTADDAPTAILPDAGLEWTVRILIASDKFKGSATGAQVAAALGAGIQETLPDVRIETAAVADGGEGTVEAVLTAGWDPVNVVVSGPTGVPVTARFAMSGAHAIIEMAAASGLDVLPGGTRQALTASTRGTGELIAAALDRGATSIVLGVGGSATTDGGAGMLEALGVSLRGSTGPIGPGGAALNDLCSVDVTNLDPRISATEFVLASDVNNPLLGERGAAAVFGPQKGADADAILRLESGLAHFARMLERKPGITPSAETPGAGAAGGVGFAALAALGARREAGIDVVQRITHLAERVRDADLVITGEGSLDTQSLGGKTPLGVATAARSAGVPAVAVCGRSMLGQDELQRAGFARVYALSELEPDPTTSMSEAAELLRRIGVAIASDLESLMAPFASQGARADDID